MLLNAVLLNAPGFNCSGLYAAFVHCGKLLGFDQLPYIGKLLHARSCSESMMLSATA